MTVYVDTSAMVKLLVDEAESELLIEWLDDCDDELVSSELMELELRRMALRADIDLSDVVLLLEGISLVSLDRAIVRSAGLLPMSYLRPLDALHIESALRLGASRILTYDHRMIEASRTVGIPAISPA